MSNIITDIIKTEDIDALDKWLQTYDINSLINGETLLYMATEGHYKSVVDFLIKRGANVNIKDSYGDTALLKASFDGNNEIVEMLINAGADVDEPDASGQTALIIASYNGHEEIVKILLKAGANIDIRGPDNDTALINAIYQGHLKITKMLVDAGADINETYSPDTPLTLASLKGHLEIVKFLIKKEVNIDAKNSIGQTALIIASYNGHKKIVKILLKAGAKIDIRGPDNDTALINAIYQGHLKITKMLVDAGADVNETYSPYTPLILASMKGHLEIVKFLINRNAIITDIDEDGNTALILASYYGHTRVAEILLDAGASIYELSNEGNTALITAASIGHVEFVKFILARFSGDNILINTQNVYGETALMRAINIKNVLISLLLLSAGADPNITNKKGKTAVDIARNVNFALTCLNKHIDLTVITDPIGLVFPDGSSECIDRRTLTQTVFFLVSFDPEQVSERWRSGELLIGPNGEGAIGVPGGEIAEINNYLILVRTMNEEKSNYILLKLQQQAMVANQETGEFFMNADIYELGY